MRVLGGIVPSVLVGATLVHYTENKGSNSSWDTFFFMFAPFNKLQSATKTMGAPGTSIILQGEGFYLPVDFLNNVSVSSMNYILYRYINFVLNSAHICINDIPKKLAIALRKYTSLIIIEKK